MKTAELKTTIDKLENLIRMQSIELDNTRNLLGRCLDNYLGKSVTVKCKRYDVPDNIVFRVGDGSLFEGFMVIEMKVLPEGMRSEMERIVMNRKELGI